MLAQAAVVVSVSQDLKGSVDAVELLLAGVAELGGKGGGGRPDFAQGGGPTAPAPTPRSRRSSARSRASRRRPNNGYSGLSRAASLSAPLCASAAALTSNGVLSRFFLPML
jgi:hypothetical protein